MKNRVVLDASALLALLHREPGEQVVGEYIQNAETMITTVNVAEILSKQQDVGIPVEEALSLLKLLSIQIVDFNEIAALHTAVLRNNTKEYGLSFADRACLALAKQLDCSVLTADQVWRNLDIGIEIILIR